MKKSLIKIFCLSLLPVSIGISAQHKFKIGLDAGYTYIICMLTFPVSKILNIADVKEYIY